jgi:alkanesulfonate monooxygenase SsuD/methylene tetrahydromethanopterin reductase-like flavin-dependent oxidoreductase (luciferase family)
LIRTWPRQAPASPAATTDASRRVEVGLLLPVREQAANVSHDLTGIVDLAVAAERAGLDSVWLGDSPLARPRPDPLPLAGAIAARTATIRIGTAALIPALRDPVLLAQSIATVDRLATGRLVLGVGAGFPNPATEAEFDLVGRPFAGRHATLDGIVTLWKTLWSGETGGTVAVGSRVYRTADLGGLTPPHRRGGPPVWLAAGASGATERRLAGPYDGWLPYLPDLDRYANLVASVPDVAHAAYTTLAIDADPRRARAAMDRYLHTYYGVGATTLQQLQLLHAGTPDSARAHLRQLVAAGATHLVVRLATPPAAPLLELLGRYRSDLQQAPA